MNGIFNLVDDSAILGLPTSPLLAVDGAEVPVFIGPCVPYFYTVFLEIAHVGVAFEKPQKFVHDGREMEFLCGDHGESIGEVKSHLVTEDRTCPGTGSVALFHTVVQDVLHQVKVGSHVVPLAGQCGKHLMVVQVNPSAFSFERPSSLLVHCPLPCVNVTKP